MKEALETYDPYYHGLRVLDTDYETYMLVYHCNEDVEEELYHTRSISIYARNPKTNIRDLIDKLKSKVPGADFDSTHGIIDHTLCPEGDLFLTPDAVNENDYGEEEEFGFSMEDMDL